MRYCGDKGISIGEKSKMKANKTDISHSKIAISSKDYETKSIEYTNVEYYLRSHAKKLEFGGSLSNSNHSFVMKSFSLIIIPKSNLLI